MSQDARHDEEVATQQRARMLGLAYVDTSALGQKPLYKDMLPTTDMYQMRIVPLEADKSNVLFGIINTTSQQAIRQLQQRFSDRRVNFALISGTGYHDYMHLYDPPKTISYQDITLTKAGDEQLLQNIS